MNRPQASKLADVITNDHLKQMFDNAKKGITNWTRVSNCNKGMTKGAAWNILAKDFDVKKDYHRLARLNMIREFGEYLPNEIRHQFDKKKQAFGKEPMHQDPIFD